MRVAFIRPRFVLWLSVLAFTPILSGLSPAAPESNGAASLPSQHAAHHKASLATTRTNDTEHFEEMSAMAHLARQVAQARAKLPHGGAGGSFHHEITRTFTQNGEDGDGDGPAGGQAEVSIAIDATGQHIVVGFNDTRGFGLNPIGVSGFAYSTNGGATFTDGGQLPTTGNPALNGSIGGTQYPQVFGDPDVKYVPGGGGLQFIYASILVKGLGTAPSFTGTVQTLSIHRSTDGGHTWQGPFEITAATNPHGGDAADKEYIDVDPDTGRVLVSWSNFTSTKNIPGGVEISTAYCDNIMAGSPPTWSAQSVLNAETFTFDTGSIPRFAGNLSNDVYVVWARSSATTATTYGSWPYGNIGFSKSTDNGVTWSAAADLTSDFFPIDYILGNDRVHSFPGLAVDNSSGAHKGNIYVVYVNNSNQDGGDIMFQRSTNRGGLFSTPVVLNSRPGADRAQWFPTVAVDPATGRINVIYDDQGVATSGDLMEMTWIYSDDGGVTWSKPSPATKRPFHAGYGNDTGQPNLGDYNAVTAHAGAVYAAFSTTPELSLFTDGQPGGQFTFPSFLPGVNPVGFATATNAPAALHLGAVSFADSGGNGFIDPGETVLFTIPLFNAVTNGISSPVTYSSISATLSSTNAGVQVSTGTQPYLNIAPGNTGTNSAAFVVNTQPGFVVGTTIEFSLIVTTAQGSATLLFAQPTGTPVATTIFSENFDGVSPGSLPAGWTTSHGGGNNTVPWTTSNTVTNAPDGNALFHINANDGLGGDATRWERAFSPSIIVPTNASFATLDFDVWYNTEDDSDFNILAYDGFFLRITDLTAGRAARSCLAEAFAQTLTTGNLQHYPKHLPRSSNSAYFEDMSVWAGFSVTWRHVHMQLPGVAGSTLELRWEYTQDNVGIGTDVHPLGFMSGVAVDNIVMNSVVLKAAPVLTWATPSSITYGTALNATQLDASASVPGTFVYTPATGSLLNTGSNLLAVVFTPTDTVHYTSATGGVGLIVMPASLTATASNAARAFGQANPPFAVALVGVTNGDNITANAGSAATPASPVGNYPIVPTLIDPANRQTNYQVTLVNGSLAVTQAVVVLSWTNPVPVLYGTALSSTQLDATASAPGTFNYTPTNGAVLASGTNALSVAFTPTDPTDYTSATGGVSLVVLPYLIFEGIDLTNPIQALADADGDGMANLMEYGLGTDPHNPADAVAGFIVSSVTNGGNQFLSLQYKQRISSPGLPLHYVPEVSADGTTWFSDAGNITQISVVPIDSQFQWVTVQDLTPTTASAPRFIRLRVGEN